MADTAGHEIAKGEEKDRQRHYAKNALQLAKEQQSKRKGKFVWNTERRAYFFETTKN